MSASSERPERLAEILREIIALSNPKRTNDSGSVPTHDSAELLSAQRVNGVDETGTSRGQEAGQKSSDG